MRIRKPLINGPFENRYPHNWFAWFPVKIEAAGDWVWLENIGREGAVRKGKWEYRYFYLWGSV